jgi:serine/threonine protein kinase
VAETPRAAQASARVHGDLVGTRVGPYLVLSRLGNGGMATVYLARDERQAGVHQLVALKCVHPHLANDAEFVSMFVDEARIASLIRHPKVCRVIDYGTSGSLRYLTMEHLCGSSLASVRRTLANTYRSLGAESALPGMHGLSFSRVAALIARMVDDACEGLHAVHELKRSDGQLLNVVHRDVSPENLMLTCDGTVKLVDFGIVKADFQRQSTQKGMVKGKLSYLPPEALQGHKLDRRADVWAIGVTAWELFTGRRLFRRKSATQTLLAVVEGEVPPPSSVRPGLPAIYDDIILKALAQDPHDRYPTARAFGRTLRSAARKTGHDIDGGDLQEWLETELGHYAVCRERGDVESTAENALLAPLSLDPPSHDRGGIETPLTVSASTPPPRGRGSRRRGWLAGTAITALTLVALSVIADRWLDQAGKSSWLQRGVAPAATRASLLAASQPLSDKEVSKDSGHVLELWDSAHQRLLWRAPLEALVPLAPSGGETPTEPTPTAVVRGRVPFTPLSPRPSDGAGMFLPNNGRRPVSGLERRESAPEPGRVRF